MAVVPLDTLTLVYHRPAGATHLLAEPAPQIFAALQAGPATFDGLLARLGAIYALDKGAADGLREHLRDLVDTGLVAAA